MRDRRLDPAAAWNSVEIHRLPYFDRRLITVDPIDVGMRSEGIGVIVPFHPHASGEDASLKGSRNRRFGDLCGMSAAEQRSSKIDQFSRAHGTTSLRWFELQAGETSPGPAGSLTLCYPLSHAQRLARVQMKRRGSRFTGSLMRRLNQLQQRPLHLVGRSIGRLELAVYPELQQRHLGRQVQAAVSMLLGVEACDQHEGETSAMAVGSATPAGIVGRPAHRPWIGGTPISYESLI